jgi:2-C-methyl-D-erythritol 2,4-cyclodiphosphate synthase
LNTGTRVGLGFDVHERAAGRPLKLGGRLFEGEDGLKAHSDGDVVCHAVADALLGGAALGDLGDHFPDSDLAWEGIDGLELLGRVVGTVVGSGLRPSSCDVTVICRSPAIGPVRNELRENLAAALLLPVNHVSVKATRPEGLGLSGEGVGCLAIAMLEPR